MRITLHVLAKPYLVLRTCVCLPLNGCFALIGSINKNRRVEFMIPWFFIRDASLVASCCLLGMSAAPRNLDSRSEPISNLRQVNDSTWMISTTVNVTPLHLIVFKN